MNNINTTIAAFQYSSCLSHRIFVYVKVSAVCLKFSLNYYLLLLTDPMPTSVLKQVVDLVALFFTKLFNRSLAAGHFPSGFKEAFITPIVKKAGLDTSDVGSYQPIWNLGITVGIWFLPCIKAEIRARSFIFPVTGRHLWFLPNSHVGQSLQ